VDDRLGFVYLHGFASSPASSKAIFFREKLEALGHAVEVPDYNEGEGGFHGLTVSRALRQTQAALDRVGHGRRGTVLIGSSLGGYLAALAASRDQRVGAVVLMAPAYDLPARWTDMVGDEGMARWRKDREIEMDHWAWGRKEKLGFSFYLDAMGHPPYPRAGCPTLILHGINDESVGIGSSRKIADGASEIRLVELDSDHSLGDVKDRLWEETRSFLDEVFPPRG